MRNCLNAIFLTLFIVLLILFVVLGIWLVIEVNRPPILTERISLGTSMKCEVVQGSIYDGDTLQVKCDEEYNTTRKIIRKKIINIRLACIDSPELRQQGGIEARDFLINLVKTHRPLVLILPQEEDRYGRTLVELVLSVDPKSDASIPDILISAQEELLKTGNARVDEQYSSHCPGIHSFREAQAMAQKQKLGIWSYNSIPPLQY